MKNLELNQMEVLQGGDAAYDDCMSSAMGFMVGAAGVGAFGGFVGFAIGGLIGLIGGTAMSMQC
ncbi:MAG: hypothetical protein L3J14_05070 [Flavobacteriaceae bacterium]|nr:hypothetical protein [Flavobacteriaceae bacterium]